MINAPFMVLLACAIFSISVPRLLGAKFPGVRTLCQWALLGTWGAGAVLGTLALFIALHRALGFAPVVLIASCVMVVTQLCGWLLFLTWLRDVQLQPFSREDALLNGLSELNTLIARASEG